MTPGRRAVAAVIAVVVLAVVAIGALESTRRQVDLTEGNTVSLSSQTTDVVDHVRRPVRVTVFMGRAEAGRAEAAALLERYRRRNPKITFRLTDPEANPGEVQRLGADPFLATVIAQMGTRTERAPGPSEQDVTAALARLLRTAKPTLCFVQGHGEADRASSAEDGWSKAAAVLQDNGFVLRDADLLAHAELPAGCRAVVLANPRADLGAATGVLARYLAGGGRALVLTDPTSSTDPNQVLRPYGLSVARGIVVEGDEGSRLAGDPVTPVVSRYRSPLPITRRLPPTVFPGAQAVQLGPDRPADGLSVSQIAATTRLAYLERTPDAFHFDPASDIGGPITLMGGADRSGNFGGAVRRTRVVVSGEADFATNAFIEDAGNSLLLVRTLDWLTVDDDLVSVSTNVGRFRPLALTDARLRYARLLTAGIVPALFLLVGALVWALRRSR
jgi:ABC-type uncharacterized transport system involved in gliding motility auxiliary subunit